MIQIVPAHFSDPFSGRFIPPGAIDALRIRLAHDSGVIRLRHEGRFVRYDGYECPATGYHCQELEDAHGAFVLVQGEIPARRPYTLARVPRQGTEGRARSDRFLGAGVHKGNWQRAEVSLRYLLGS